MEFLQFLGFVSQSAPLIAFNTHEPGFLFHVWQIEGRQIKSRSQCPALGGSCADGPML
jgi:hypothetical protein